MKKCLRSRCERKASRQGLCHQHYELAPRGYIPAGGVRERVHLLRERGYSLQELSSITGLSQPTLQISYDTVQLATARAVMAIPVPTTTIAGGAAVPAIGTVRRAQSLVAFGYPWMTIAAEMGIGYKRLHRILKQDKVLASTAARMAVVFEQLQMTPGPASTRSCRRALDEKGWSLPWAWDEDTIDDPNATPNPGAHGCGDFIDRYTELRELGFFDMEIADRWGIQMYSLERQLIRHGLRISTHQLEESA